MARKPAIFNGHASRGLETHKLRLYDVIALATRCIAEKPVTELFMPTRRPLIGDRK